MTFKAGFRTPIVALDASSGPYAGSVVHNRETSFQLLVADDMLPLEIARWRGDDAFVLSVYVLEGGCVLVGAGESAQNLSAGEHVLYRVPMLTPVTVAPHAGAGFAAVVFQFSEAYLLRHCPENCPNLCQLTTSPAVAGLQVLGSGTPASTTHEQRALVDQICSAPLPEHLKSVYRDVKIAELLVLQLEEILYGTRSKSEAGLREHELQRVYRVRDILRNDPSQSYTLLGLAHEVGTNDATLKKHFKQVLNCTVFAYLTSCRMARAKEMLVDERKPIAEIAQCLGYKHVSHFSASFRKYYGSAPTKFLESE